MSTLILVPRFTESLHIHLLWGIKMKRVVEGLPFEDRRGHKIVGITRPKRKRLSLKVRQGKGSRNYNGRT